MAGVEGLRPHLEQDCEASVSVEGRRNQGSREVETDKGRSLESIVSDWRRRRLRTVKIGRDQAGTSRAWFFW